MKVGDRVARVDLGCIPEHLVGRTGTIKERAIDYNINCPVFIVVWDEMEEYMRVATAEVPEALYLNSG